MPTGQWRRWVVALAITVCVTAHAQGTPERIIEVDSIVAVVNDDVIVMSELLDMLQTVRRELRASGTRPPPTRVLERQVLDRLILERLQLQVAQRIGIKIRDGALNRAVADIAKRNGLGLNEFREILERDGVNFADFRERIRKQMLIARVRQRQVQSRIRVREQEIDRYLELQDSGGGTVSEYRLAHILINVPPAASVDEEKAREKVALDVVQKLNAGADFGALARKFSQGSQAENGGDLGWRLPQRVPSLFSGIVSRLGKGEIGGPVRSPSGFHIVKVTDVKGEAQTVIRQTRPQHILIQTSELTSDDDARIRLEQLRERIIQGTSFEELARANSDDRGSAVKDGDLGWVNPGDLVEEFEKVMDGLPVGELSKPFKTAFGWHIVRVVERRDYDSTLELKRARALESIRKRRTADELEAWLAQMRDEAYIEYRLEE